MAGGVWVLVDHWKGQLSEHTFELLVLGRELAGGLGCPLHAVVLGHPAAALVGGLGAADTVLLVDDPALAEPDPEAGCAALAPLISARAPRVVLGALSNVSADLVGLVAARLRLPFVNFCTDVRVTGGALEARCLLFGGKMESTVGVPEGPSIVGVLPGARVGTAAHVNSAPAVETAAATVPADRAVRFEAYREPPAGDVDVTRETVLVSVGRGIQTQDNIELAQDLAAALGGAVCASRPVIDQGWLPLTRQIGKSGATVKPKLYVAAGISGAPEHVEGMKHADLIVAVNTDRQAPIFAVAHYGIVGECVEILPALTQAMLAKKG